MIRTALLNPRCLRTHHDSAEACNSSHENFGQWMILVSQVHAQKCLVTRTPASGTVSDATCKRLQNRKFLSKRLTTFELDVECSARGRP